MASTSNFSGLIWIILAIVILGYSYQVAGWLGMLVTLVSYILVSISALLGFIPIIGVFLYALWVAPMAQEWVIGLFSLSASQLAALHPLFVIIFVAGLLFSIFYTIMGGLIFLALLASK